MKNKYSTLTCRLNVPGKINNTHNIYNTVTPCSGIHTILLNSSNWLPYVHSDHMVTQECHFIINKEQWMPTTQIQTYLNVGAGPFSTPHIMVMYCHDSPLKLSDISFTISLCM
jgi:hypothetical protein